MLPKTSSCTKSCSKASSSPHSRPILAEGTLKLAFGCFGRVSEGPKQHRAKMALFFAQKELNTCEELVMSFERAAYILADSDLLAALGNKVGTSQPFYRTSLLKAKARPETDSCSTNGALARVKSVPPRPRSCCPDASAPAAGASKSAKSLRPFLENRDEARLFSPTRADAGVLTFSPSFAAAMRRIPATERW